MSLEKCPQCGMWGQHKLSCSERPNRQVKLTVHLPLEPERPGPLDYVVRVMALLGNWHDIAGAIRWLEAPHCELGDRTPMDVISQGGGQVVVDMLEAARQGLPT